MNVLTRSVDRTATDVVLETQWPRLPLSIGITSAFHTAMSPMSSYGFERTELPMTDMVYNYKTGSGDVELSNFTTWIIGAMSYDFEWNKLPMTDMVYNYKTGSGDVELSNFTTWVVDRTFTPPTESHFRNRILQAKLPAKSIVAGVQPPTGECRAKSYEIWQHLYTKFGLLPVRTSASVEGGITLAYEHATNGRTLIVETYNDLEVAALINESKRIVYSENINALNFDCVFLEFNV